MVKTLKSFSWKVSANTIKRTFVSYFLLFRANRSWLPKCHPRMLNSTYVFAPYSHSVYPYLCLSLIFHFVFSIFLFLVYCMHSTIFIWWNSIRILEPENIKVCQRNCTSFSFDAQNKWDHYHIRACLSNDRFNLIFPHLILVTNLLNITWFFPIHYVRMYKSCFLEVYTAFIAIIIYNLYSICKGMCGFSVFS